MWLVARQRDNKPSRSSLADQEVPRCARDRERSRARSNDPHRLWRFGGIRCGKWSTPRERPENSRRRVPRRDRRQSSGAPERVVAHEREGGSARPGWDDRITGEIRLPAVRRGRDTHTGRCGVHRSAAIRAPRAERGCDLGRHHDRQGERYHGEAPGQRRAARPPPHRKPMRAPSARQHDPPAYIGPGPGSCSVFAPRLRRKRANARPPGLTLSCSVHPHSVQVTDGVSSAFAHPPLGPVRARIGGRERVTGVEARSGRKDAADVLGDVGRAPLLAHKRAPGREGERMANRGACFPALRPRSRRPAINVSWAACM
jgi:hypothetical protein